MENSDLRSVDVVVPVYRDIDVTRRCIESVLDNKTEALATLIVIDDASPDADVVSYCDELAQQGKVKLLRNKKNLGFVASVNLGMKLNPENDVLLLNSDTEVSGDWLDRLRYCAYVDDTTGTVTPFSNNATLCSYPLFMMPSELPKGWDLNTLDKLFADTNKQQRQQIPTAVGFCMYIRRECMDKIGFFDEESFGRGYGEESDFSMRVNEIGWKNMLCADVFVYHQGGVSFSTETKQRLTAAEEIIAQKYPSYLGKITDFMNEDPLRQYRDRIDIARSQRSEKDAKHVLAEAKQYRDILVEKVDVYRHQYELSIAERDVSVAEYREQRNNNAGLLTEIQEEVCEQNKLITEQNKVIEHRSVEVEDKNKIIVEQGEDLKLRAKEIVGKNKVIAKQNQVIEHRSLEVEDKNKIIAEQGEDLKLRAKEIVGKNKIISDQNEVIEYRTLVIEDKNNLLAEQEKVLEHHALLIADQNEVIEYRTLVIEDKNNLLAEQEKVLEHHALLIADQNEVIEYRTLVLEDVKGQLARIQNSRFWRYTEWIRSLLR